MLIPFLVFLAAYLLNIFYVTVLYHRGLAHGAVVLTPAMKKFTVQTGNWVTGIDPKAWVCMHRMHHEFSDTEKDPHSPVQYGVFGTARAQVRNYERTLAGLAVKNPKFTKFVGDLDFDIFWLNKKQLWHLPYLIHFVTASILGIIFHSPLLGVAYFLGIMSHPIQGWMVNALAHTYGYRNFKTNDQSTNNLPVAVLVFGEGLQNNHHHSPRSAKFSVKWWEPDPGYALCKIGKFFGLFEAVHR